MNSTVQRLAALPAGNVTALVLGSVEGAVVASNLYFPVACMVGNQSSPQSSFAIFESSILDVLRKSELQICH